MHTSSAARVPQTVHRRKKRDLRRDALQLHIRLRKAACPALHAAAVFLFTFIQWFHIPSPFGAAALLAAGQKPSVFTLGGLGASLLLRLVWGIEADWWQYTGCGLLWLVLQKCRPKAGVETAALAALSMLPRFVACIAARDSLAMLYSFAAIPMAMLFAAVLRYGCDCVKQNGISACGAERFSVLLAAPLAVSALGYFRIASVSLGQVAAVCCTLWFACASGFASGAAGGIACGLALALIGHDVQAALALAIGGALAGLPLAGRRRLLALPCMLAANGLCMALSAAAAPLDWLACAAGTAVSLLVPSSALDRMKPWLRASQPVDRSMENAFITQRISHKREAIMRLARALPEFQADRCDAAEEARMLCSRCEQRDQCQQSSRLIGTLEKGEEQTVLPALEKQGCLQAQRMAKLAQDSAQIKRRTQARTRKAHYERELTLNHLAALSQTLGELGEMAAGESFNDLRAAHVITLALEEQSLPARLLYARRVDGRLLAALEAQGIGLGQHALDGLLRYLAQEEDIALRVSRSAHGRIELEEVPLYSASVGVASLSAGGAGNVCGDACVVRRFDGGRLLMLLCDGMGHGEEAHQQSEKTLELLTLLLEAGYTRHQAITAVNGIMLGAQVSERFSTVDLADVDLWTGDVFFEKLGACASWVVRGNRMKKLEGSALPLGIVEEAVPSARQYRLHSGDILILMSDGVADAFPDDAVLRRMLEESLYIQPQRMADAILRGALVASGGAPRDDMSVMVLLLMGRQHA